MSEKFKYDVFLCHSSRDLAVADIIAQRLKADGLHVWFRDWQLATGDDNLQIEDGLECSRILVFLMSAAAFSSHWSELEEYTFRFRDPLNNARRFIPVRLDDAPIPSSLSQLLYINWLKEPEQAYAKLLEACQLQIEERKDVEAPTIAGEGQVRGLRCSGGILSYAFSSDGKRALTGVKDKTVRVWDISTGYRLLTLKGHDGKIWAVDWTTDELIAVSGSDDNTIRVWDLKARQCVHVLKGHTDIVRGVAIDGNNRWALSGSDDGSVRAWELTTGNCLRIFEGHAGSIRCIVFDHEQGLVISGGEDCAVRLWDLNTGHCIRVLTGHDNTVASVAVSMEQRLVLSGAHDKTVRLWDLNTGQCLRILEGHTGAVKSITWSADQRFVLSGAEDGSLRVWNIETGRLLLVLPNRTANLRKVAWNADQGKVLSADHAGFLRIWDAQNFNLPPTTGPFALSLKTDQVQYTNAKVLLVGESGSGKTGLSKVLAGEAWQPTDSTVGAWATQWKLPVSSSNDIEREIWLWDFGGQADQRLIHQLYMDDAALAVLVFDGQKEDLFETLGQWDRDLTRAARKKFTKLLVAGRIDAGGLRVSRHQVQAFAKERGYSLFLETSAKAKIHCDELKNAILEGINWEDIPWRSSPLLFTKLKTEIVRLKDSGRVLIRFNELRETLQLRLIEEQGHDVPRIKDEELTAVLSLLAGPGVVWELTFGSWVLLQPERINAYAQAVIRTMREDRYERGCLPEELVLNGKLTYQSSLERLDANEERFVLLAMHQTLIERGLCLREHTDQGSLLIFPSYYRRERPELVGHPAVLVSYRFNGFLDDLYATLVVRLHHTASFQSDELWRYAADFRTHTGKQLGVKLTRRGEGAGELDVYFDPTIEIGERIIFSKYVHEHLLKNAKDVERLRYYICPYCATPVGNREVAMRRLNRWLDINASGTRTFEGKPNLLHQDKPTIVCAECEKRVPLWDELEQHFASPETKKHVRELEAQSEVELDNESRERALVGDVISTVALAGQICREKNVSDHGIDMEIEFKNDFGEATGQMLLLQLKSGDSYLRRRQRDGVEIFTIKNERHARYWMAQKFPVFLVIRTSDGQVRWMEISDWLKQASDGGKYNVHQIVFNGERMDVLSVRRWRELTLRQVH